MRCVVGIDLGSTTTKAVMLDPGGRALGHGITNSRGSYGVAASVARDEAHGSARARLLHDEGPWSDGAALEAALRLEAYLQDLTRLETAMGPAAEGDRGAAVAAVMAAARQEAPALFQPGTPRRSDFFRDLAAESYVRGAEALGARARVPFERLMATFDRAILEVERELKPRDWAVLANAAVRRCGFPPEETERALAAVGRVMSVTLEEVAYVGTGYGRQSLPFPREAVRSEILCHGRGAHHLFPGTRTVLDIGGQDTKAIQVDERGTVTSFQMNDRCAAGCGRYLGYIADELSLGLHELGPLALTSRNPTRISSTCTVFAGAELRERLAAGERREDILAGLHRAVMLRAMSLLERSGGVRDELTFTGGVCRNAMAVKLLRDLVDQHHGARTTLNVHADSIYVGALGAALMAWDDVQAGRAVVPPALRDAAQGRA
jgi:benzoyl-CoA reductase subunit A